MKPKHPTRFRYTLPRNQTVYIYAHTDAEACVELERLQPGSSGLVIRVDRDPKWWVGQAAEKASA